MSGGITTKLNLEDYVIENRGGVKLLDDYQILIDLENEGVVLDYMDQLAYIRSMLPMGATLSYYAAQKEDFFPEVGWHIAASDSADYLIMENMS